MSAFWVGLLLGGLIVPCLLIVGMGVWVLLKQGE